MVGKSGAAINGYLANGTCPKTVELAAQFVFDRDFCPKRAEAEKKKQVAAIVKGETAHVKTVIDLLTNLGGTAQYIGEF